MSGEASCGTWFIGCLALLLLGSGAAGAENRVAIIIGNSAYRNVERLPNTLNDANDITASLERLGFTVSKVVNATYEDMRRSFLDFSRRAQDAEMAIVYFAGHGIEAAGENWLIPIDARLDSDSDVQHEAIALKSVVKTVGKHDGGSVSSSSMRAATIPSQQRCCARSRTRRQSRAAPRGSSPVDNVLVAYAAKDGTTASDGTGRNSPFTGALLKHIETPGLEINLLFRTVRDDVMSVTQREQRPFLYGSLSKELIYLKAAPATGGPVPHRLAYPRRNALEHDPDFSAPALFEEFLRRFPESLRAAEARERLETIKRSQTATLAAPVRPATPCGPGPTVGVSLSRACQVAVSGGRMRAQASRCVQGMRKVPLIGDGSCRASS